MWWRRRRSYISHLVRRKVVRRSPLRSLHSRILLKIPPLEQWQELPTHLRDPKSAVRGLVQQDSDISWRGQGFMEKGEIMELPRFTS